MSRLYQSNENFTIHILNANILGQAICGISVKGMRKLHPDIKLSVVDCRNCNLLYLKQVRNGKKKN